MIKGVIFDMDGTMFDTEPISARCWIEAGEKLGIPITKSMVYTFCGKTMPAIKGILEKAVEVEVDYEEVVRTRQEIYDNIIKTEGVPHKEGLVELLQYLKDEHIPAAVSTSTNRETAEMIIKKAGVYGYFTAFVYGDMVEKSKPAPDIFWEAARRIGKDPKECLVVEDSPAGIMAGKAAGGYTILIPDVADVTEEAKEGITAQMNNLSEIVQWMKRRQEDEKIKD